MTLPVVFVLKSIADVGCKIMHAANSHSSISMRLQESVGSKLGRTTKVPLLTRAWMMICSLAMHITSFEVSTDKGRLD